jgi:spore coat polysaccharide biosynthesis protein SpsF
MSRILVVILARTGSTRLPGKVLYPLDGRPVLEHVVARAASTESVDDVVIATSNEPQDEVIARYASRFGAAVLRGSETNVVGRFEQAVEQYDPEIVVRVTGDCPLLSPTFIDASVEQLQTNDVEYVSVTQNRTFPRGVSCEVFTAASFEQVSAAATDPRHREHVTPCYRDHPEEFALYNIESTEVFDTEWLQNRTDLRLTLDEPADYQLLETVYREVEYDGILDLGEAVRYIDENGLAEINRDVTQKPTT